MKEFIGYLERKIEGCDNLGGMEREKAIYQSVLKDYRKQFAISDVRQRLINHIETRINYFSGGESMKSLREISTDRDIVKELESLIKLINDDNF